MYNKQSLGIEGTDSFGDYVLVLQKRDRRLRKQWHLSSTQLGIALGISGAFWLIVGIAATARILLAWGCVGTWH